MNVLITGFPGTGKTAIAHELKRRGHRAYDPEHMRGFTHVEDRATGERIHAPADVPRGWYDSVGAQVWDEIKIRELLNSPEDTFVCAFTHNQELFYDLFDYVFVLTLDDAELEQRLLSRPGNKIGKTAEEMADILTLHKQFETKVLAHGAATLNAQTGTHELADQILRVVESA